MNDEIIWTFCPSCGTEHDERDSFMGSLGFIEHHRCRYCGWEWALNIEPMHQEGEHGDRA